MRVHPFIMSDFDRSVDIEMFIIAVTVNSIKIVSAYVWQFRLGNLVANIIRTAQLSVENDQ